LKRSDEQLKEVRNLLEKTQTNQNKVILSEAEKRERRAMERKLSEMEEELKVNLNPMYFLRYEQSLFV
jgi:protein phosphatase 1 regulatory subunit 12A